MYSPCIREETNRVIRKKYKFIDYFLRLIIVNNLMEKGYYFSKQSSEILGFVREVLKKGINVGDSHFKTLNYSAS